MLSRTVFWLVSRLEIQPFYAKLRRDVETVLRSLSVDDIIEERRNLILSAL